MRLTLFKVLLPLGVWVSCGFLSGCAGQSPIKPAEVLDERTGMTVAALQEPIEFVESSPGMLLSNGKRASFAYLGPVEWDQMGDITYGLWVHIAPGNDRQAADIRAQGAVTMTLDSGAVALVARDAPKLGHGPYQPVVSWGQTAYFVLTVETLKLMAASDKLTLDFRAADDSTIEFLPEHVTRTTLSEFVKTRGITGD